jgi:hypothetical protein
MNSIFLEGIPEFLMIQKKKADSDYRPTSTSVAGL